MAKPNTRRVFQLLQLIIAFFQASFITARYCFLSHEHTQKYLHESRHRHALKRVRGYSGRFSGKDQSQSPQKSPVSGSLPPAQLSTVQQLGMGGRNNQASGTGLFPPELSSDYQTVTSMAELAGTVVQGMHVVPGMSAAGGDLSTVSGQEVSIALNQLGTSESCSSANPVVTTVPSSGDRQLQESLGDATIQGLINATHSFTVPVLPTDLVPSLSSPSSQAAASDSTVSISSKLSFSTPQITVQSGKANNTVSTSFLDVGKTLLSNAVSTVSSMTVCEAHSSTADDSLHQDPVVPS